jgi:hypothetical protein
MKRGADGAGGSEYCEEILPIFHLFNHRTDTKNQSRKKRQRSVLENQNSAQPEVVNENKRAQEDRLLSSSFA